MIVSQAVSFQVFLRDNGPHRDSSTTQAGFSVTNIAPYGSSNSYSVRQFEVSEKVVRESVLYPNACSWDKGGRALM